MTIDSFPKWKLMKDIYCKSDKKPIMITDLAKLVGTGSANPYFREILKLLFDNDMILDVQMIGSAKLIRINKPKLKEFIDNSYFYKEYAEYIYHTKLIYVDI